MTVAVRQGRAAGWRRKRGHVGARPRRPPRVLGGGRWALLAALVANGVAQAASAIAAGLSVERLFALIAAAQPPGVVAVGLPVAALACAGVAAAWLRARERVDAERLGQGYVHALRMHLYDHLVNMSPRSLQTSSQGATALRFVGDLTAIRRWVSLGVARLLVATTVIVITAAALARIRPALAVAVVVIVVVGMLAAIMQAPAQREAARLVRRRRARMAGNVTEQIAALGAIQANGAIDRERQRFRRQSRRLRSASISRAQQLGKLDAVSEVTATVASLAVLATALVTGLDSSAAAGALAIVATTSAQVRGLTRVQEYRQGAVVSREAVARFLARPRTGEHRADAVLPPGSGCLELDSVSVEGALHGVTAAVPAGRMVAVIGPNGSGKSTLLTVVAQLVEPSSGAVRLDGVDLARVALPEVHRAVGLVSADLPLLRGTVRDNLVYGRPEVPDEELDEVVRLCGLDSSMALPSGLDTPVREQGRALSAGQRQRVQLARALLGRPRVLLLDEVDANLDPATVSIVDAAIRHFGGTCLMVTHRLELAARADEVWYLEHGRLTAAGSPSDLLYGDGTGARLFAPAAA